MSRRNISFSLKRILKAKHITQRELAAKMNVPESTMRSWAQGIRTVDDDQIKMLAEALEVNAIDLYRDEYSYYNPIPGSVPIKVTLSEEEATPSAVLDMIPDEALADFLIDHITIAGRPISREKLRRILKIILDKE